MTDMSINTGGPAATENASDVPGEEKSLKTAFVETGSGMLQTLAPVKQIHQHVCAFHSYAEDPRRQVLAHHFCSHLNEDMRQCVIYDTDQPNARLIGVEYIISRRLFESLPQEERQYWHSHVYEVSSGLLIAPGVPQFAEDMDMRQVINSYGKTWHFWQVDRGDPLPLGPPSLMMSLLSDNDLRCDLLKLRDDAYGISSKQRREHRATAVKADPPEPHPDADQWAHRQRGARLVLQDFELPHNKGLDSVAEQSASAMRMPPAGPQDSERR